jgi:hypothetical protein
MRFRQSVEILIFLFLCCCTSGHCAEIGVYYFPGWASTSPYWSDIKGLAGSRSPGKSWPDREPILGFYPEEQQWVAEKHIEWASSYGLKFFIYDWYWTGSKPDLNHAIDNFVKAKNKGKMKFALMWVASHYGGVKTGQEFTSMVDYWLDHYLQDPQYLLLDEKPVVLIYSEGAVIANATKYGKTMKDLLVIARDRAKSRGLKGIYFVGISQARSSIVNGFLPDNGYDAVTGYNYLSKGFTGEYVWNKEPAATTYSELMDGYRSEWNWFMSNSSIPYLLPMSAGYDSSPWGSSVHCSSTPQSFKQMLVEGKNLIEKYKNKTKGIGIIYAWNELAEGGIIEPTKKWRFKYLEAIEEVFGK